CRRMHEEPAKLCHGRLTTHDRDAADEIVVRLGDPDTLGRRIEGLREPRDAARDVRLERVIPAVLPRVQDPVYAHDCAEIAWLQIVSELHASADKGRL